MLSSYLIVFSSSCAFIGINSNTSLFVDCVFNNCKWLEALKAEMFWCFIHCFDQRFPTVSEKETLRFAGFIYRTIMAQLS